MLKLHSYFRSSAAYRCRIALNLKGLAYETGFVHLVKDGGQQNAPFYRALNPQALVPTLEHDGRVITQSLAIIEYLDELHPEPPLLPGDAELRAKVRAFALAITCDIHPINNLRVLNYLKGPLQQGQAAVDSWYRHWVETGLAACEALLPRAGSASAASRRWPTSVWCLSSTTPAASIATSQPCRACSPSTRRPAPCQPSPRPHPRPSRMRRAG
jgi:maleylacetoacetate isomerase